MHLRITAVLCCAILLGFATASETSNKYYEDGIPIDDIDDVLEGSGGNTEVSHDLESSGSGFGPDDEDSTYSQGGDLPRKNVEPTIIPRIDDPEINKPVKEDDISKSGTRFVDSGVIMNPKSEDRPTSFFAQPGILAAVIGGAVVGLLCAILVVMFIVYRMRKKDEGSYPLDEPKRSPTSNSYNRGNNKEFFA